MRLLVPDYEVEFQINQAGVGLINLLAHDLFAFIDIQLKNLLGANWLEEMLSVDPTTTEVNFRDPSILLKDLGRKTHATLRLPLNNKVDKDQLYDFYNLLNDIHGERHLWVHQEIKSTKKQFLSLVNLINKVATMLDLPTKSECLELFSNDDRPAVELQDSAKPSILIDTKLDLASAFQTLTKDDLSLVGSVMTGPYLEYSYTLHLNGEIKDRETGVLLSTSRNNADLIGALLIARKPKGGRIRVTKDGVLVGYFEDHWGFLAQIEAENWFDGHL